MRSTRAVMTARIVVGLAAWVTSLATAVTAQDLADGLESDVLEWIDQLDANQLSQRKAAERALIEAGPEILDWLPSSDLDRSIEAATRLSRVRSTLQAQRTKAESQAKRIRLDEIATLGEALEAISRDSGIEFETRAEQSVAVQPVATVLPFWHAIDYVLDQTNLDVDFYGGDRGQLRLESRRPGRPSRVDAAAYAGVYRIEPTAVTAQRVLNQPDLSGLTVRLEIAWEPRLTPIGLTIPVDQLSGKLDDQEQLRPQESGDTIDVATNSEIAFSEVFLPLQLPAQNPRTIESLTGVIQALLPGEGHQFEFSLAELGAPQTHEAMTVRIEDVRRIDPLHEVRVAVSLQDAGRALESHRHWVFENQIYLLRDGTRIDHLGYEVYRQGPDAVGIGYLFDFGSSSEGVSLIYMSPTSVIQSEVPFVLRDIPLP